MSGGNLRSHERCKKSKKYNPDAEICVVCGWMQKVHKTKLFDTIKKENKNNDRIKNN